VRSVGWWCQALFVGRSSLWEFFDVSFVEFVGMWCWWNPMDGRTCNNLGLDDSETKLWCSCIILLVDRAKSEEME
jgi:hypothetical protein